MRNQFRSLAFIINGIHDEMLTRSVAMSSEDDIPLMDREDDDDERHVERQTSQQLGGDFSQLDIPKKDFNSALNFAKMSEQVEVLQQQVCQVASCVISRC